MKKDKTPPPPPVFSKHMQTSWVRDEEVAALRLWHSTMERRIVLRLKETAVKVIPVGSYRVPIFRDFDVISFVEMTPKKLSIEFSGNAASSDGVPVIGSVTVQAVVIDTEQALKRVSSDAASEEELLRTCVLSGIQEAIASQKWRNIVSITGEFCSAIESIAAATLQRSDACFVLRSVTVEKLVPANRDLAESLERLAKAREEESLKRELAELRSDRAKIEKLTEEDNVKNKIELDRLRKEAEIHNDREQLKLEKERQAASIENQNNLAELLKTEEGRIAALPNETFRFLAKELEVKVINDKDRQSLYRDLLRTSQSFQAGQFNALKSYIGQQYGIKISDETPTSLPLEGDESEQSSLPVFSDDNDGQDQPADDKPEEVSEEKAQDK